MYMSKEEMTVFTFESSIIDSAQNEPPYYNSNKELSECLLNVVEFIVNRNDIYVQQITIEQSDSDMPCFVHVYGKVMTVDVE